MTFKADKDTKIALIPIGYADGIPRKLSNNWNVKIKNKYAWFPAIIPPYLNILPNNPPSDFP